MIRNKPLLMLAALLLSFQSLAATVKTEHLDAELISDNAVIRPGQSFVVGLHLKMQERWHTYWQNPGDSGLATSIEWKLPAGFTTSSLQWPAPQKLPFSTLMNYGYADEVVLLTQVTAPADLVPGKPLELRGHADWLVCVEEECVPGDAELTLPVQVQSASKPADARSLALIATAQAAMPMDPKGWQLRAVRDGNGYRLTVQGPVAGTNAPVPGYFFASDTGVIEPSAPQAVTGGSGLTSVSLQQSTYASAPATRLRGVWVAQRTSTGAPGITALRVDVPVDGSIAGVAGPASGSGLGSASDPLGTESSGLLTFFGVLMTAFVGGLILNLMPCVFPVLSIKILAFVEQAGGDRRKIAQHGWMFGLGVMVSFWLLAGALLLLRAQGSQLAWGYQLQSPLFVLALSGVLFTLALSLLGVFEIGVGVVGAASRVEARSGLGGAFTSGALATLLATPCTAPFMGSALAYALTQSSVKALTVFSFLAAGMAAPYLLLSLFPAWLKYLPRPGAWMESFKQFMAFPLLGTVVWLLWVFGLQTGMDGMQLALTALLVLAVTLWAWGRWGALHRKPVVRRVAAAMGIAGLAVVLTTSWNAAQQGSPSGSSATAAAGADRWEPYSAQRLAELRAQKRAVFVNFGAAWCATCIVNDRLVLDTDEVRAAFASKKVVLLRADWTRRDPEITRTLAAHGKSGVPFHLLYAGSDSAPAMARDLVGKSELLAILNNITD